MRVKVVGEHEAAVAEAGPAHHTVQEDDAGVEDEAPVGGGGLGRQHVAGRHHGGGGSCRHGGCYGRKEGGTSW